MEDTTYRGDEARGKYLANGGNERLYDEWSSLADDLGGVVGYEPGSTEKSRPGCRNALLVAAVMGVSTFLALRAHFTTENN